MEIKKILTLVCIFTGCLNLNAQKGITGLVNAERDFARFTSSHTIREGFLKFMDSAGVIFSKASPVNALAFYQQQKAGGGYLNWAPAFAVISASGELGVTTGPYEFRRTKEDTVLARGNFSSLWHLDAQGAWKNMVDLGTSYISYNALSNEVVKEVILQDPQNKPADYQDLLRMDARLNVFIHEKNTQALADLIAPESWLNREGKLPITGADAVISEMTNFGGCAEMIPLNGGMSKANDLAWFYGTIACGSEKENYLRVWILRNGKWRVILQTIKA